MNLIGIMQGRLSPLSDGRIQSFPVNTWREEFARAQETGLDCIEWIYESGTDTQNPLQTDAGIAEIRHLSSVTNVGVHSICADYYMAKRLVSPDGSPDPQNIKHLQWLLGRAGQLGVRYIVLPFVDSSSLRSPQEINGLLAVLRASIPAAAQAETELHLETDLSAASLLAILEQLANTCVRANYDIGNSASLGYDPAEELTLLAPWVGSVHIKDRILGGGTVPLGTGAADFTTCFRLIRKAGFEGPFILQTARQSELGEVELARRNRDFVRKHWEAAAQQT
jgi:hexulose-6-phosphate isomerase